MKLKQCFSLPLSVLQIFWLLKHPGIFALWDVVRKRKLPLSWPAALSFPPKGLQWGQIWTCLTECFKSSVCSQHVRQMGGEKLLSEKIAFKMGKDYLHVPFFRDWHFQKPTMGLVRQKADYGIPVSRQEPHKSHSTALHRSDFCPDIVSVPSFPSRSNHTIDAVLGNIVCQFYAAMAHWLMGMFPFNGYMER